MARVHVVGAGPAGSIAAISALRAGHGVVVSEEDERAGMRSTCSGLFSEEGLRSLSGYIDSKKIMINQVRGADIHFADEIFSVRARGVVAKVCDRAELDARLASRAESEGAEMHFGERVKGSFRSDSVIGADGPNSSVARRFLFPPIRRYYCSMKAVMEYEVSDKMDRSIITMHLSQRRFPGFFGWVIPHSSDLAEFGVGVALPGQVRKSWDHLMGMYGIRKPHKVASDIIPAEARKRTALHAGRSRVLLVGDAAGQVKATTGGGVVFGGNCAALAGKHANDPHRYELEWRARYGPDLFLHRKIRDYLDTLPDNRLAALGRRLKRLRLDDYLSEHGSMDRPTRMVKPQMLAHLVLAMAGLK